MKHILVKHYYQHASGRADTIEAVCDNRVSALIALANLALSYEQEITNEKLDAALENGILSTTDYALEVYSAKDVWGYDPQEQGVFEIDNPTCGQVSRRKLVFVVD